MAVGNMSGVDSDGTRTRYVDELHVLLIRFRMYSCSSRFSLSENVGFLGAKMKISRSVGNLLFQQTAFVHNISPRSVGRTMRSCSCIVPRIFCTTNSVSEKRMKYFVLSSVSQIFVLLALRSPICCSSNRM